MKKIIVLTLMAMSLPLAAGLAAAESPAPVIISLTRFEALAPALRTMGLDFLLERDGRIFVVASEADLLKLERAGIAYAVETERFAPATPSTSPARQPQAAGGINGDFHDYFEVEQELKALESEFPGLAALCDLGDSLEGRQIYGLKLSANVQSDENEARIIFLGCHHAREWISVEVPLLFARYALEHYASDAAIKGLLDRSEIWVVPLTNPDGLEYSIHTYRYWRKNRRDNGDGSFGVDLNRNYDYAWGLDDEGSSPDPDSAVYRGASPFSEPELQAVRDLMTSRPFQALISFHNYSQTILYPWGYTEALAPDTDRLGELAAGMAGRIQAVNGRMYSYGPAGSSLYLTNGETTDWAYGVFGTMAYTVELPPQEYEGGGFFNAEAEIQPIFLENLPSMTYLIEESIASYVPPAGAPGSGERRMRKPGRDTPRIKD